MQKYKGTIETKFWWIIPFLFAWSVSNVNNDARVYTFHITPWFDIGFNLRSTKK